jgi:polyhydroxyalkanoate synthesis regulator phasin
MLDTDKKTLFGYSLERIKKKNQPSPIPKESDDGVVTVANAGFNTYGIDLELNFKNIGDLINKYRQLALDPLVDTSIDDIINEMISSDLTELPVKIDLSKIKIADNVKQKIQEEFKYICKLLDFEKKCHSIARKWYIDGQIYYHKVVDPKNLKAGIKELRNIDPINIKPVKQKIKDNQPISEFDKNYLNDDHLEFYIYVRTNLYQNANYNTPTTSSNTAVKFTKDSITYVGSGVVDYSKKMNVSYLNKAIKAVNQLRMLEDSIVVYSLTRATEKRIFYIDVGNLPNDKAENYLREVMKRYKNKLQYNSTTGEVTDKRHMTTMLEDYWLPRRDSSKGTEITTLPAGQNLGDLSDNMKFFLTKALNALNVPSSRQGDNGGGSFNIGRGSEISRDEIKFAKFVGRLRKQFSQIFLDPLKTQLILTGVLTLEEWDFIENDIQIDYIYDNHYSEIKDTELANDRLNLLIQMEQYLGKYYSKKWIQRNVLKMSDEEIEEMALEINTEISYGIIPDPLQQAQIAQQTPKHQTK